MRPRPAEFAFRAWQPKPNYVSGWCEETGFVPHDGQRQIIESAGRDRYSMAVCGVRFGKSVIAAKIAAADAVLMPGSRVWCVGPTYEIADKVFREVWDDVQAFGAMRTAGSSYSLGVLVTKLGSVVERKSADNPTSLIGEAVDRMIVDEFARIKPRILDRELLPRLTDHRGRLFAITTPNGYDHVYERHTAIQRGDMPGWWSIQAPTWANTTVFPGGYEDPEIQARRRYYEDLGTPELFEQEYGAEFRAVSGRVFKRWDRQTMVVPHDEAIAGVSEWWLGYDWGWDHPAVWALVGRTSARQWRVCDEEYSTGLGVDEIILGARSILTRNGLHPSSLQAVYYDPSRPEQAAEFRRNKLQRVAPAENDQGAGVIAVGGAIGRPGGFLLSSRCKKIAMEFDGLHHPDGYTGGGLRWVKINDDGFDAVRYVIASVTRREKSVVSAAYAH